MKKLLVAFLVLVMCSGAFAQDASQSIILSTTTSTQATGLLDTLLPAFTKATGIAVKPIAVGTGKALEMARHGDADVVMVHARKLEDQFIADGYGTHAFDLMYNDFVLLGPNEDPSKVKGSKTAIEAFQKIASGSDKFISRGDKSGTHEKELEIWESAKTKMTGPTYVECGQGMAEALKMAGEMNAYILCDRATWGFMKKKMTLAIVYENPEELKNPYGVIAVSKDKISQAKTDLAIKFIDWVTSAEGQKIISEFKIEGETLFHLSVGKR